MRAPADGDNVLARRRSRRFQFGSGVGSRFRSPECNQSVGVRSNAERIHRFAARSANTPCRCFTMRCRNESDRPDIHIVLPRQTIPGFAEIPGSDRKRTAFRPLAGQSVLSPLNSPRIRDGRRRRMDFLARRGFAMPHPERPGRGFQSSWDGRVAMSESVLSIDDGGVCVITLNRPARLNAINPALLAGLNAALARPVLAEPGITGTSGIHASRFPSVPERSRTRATTARAAGAREWSNPPRNCRSDSDF